MRPAAPWREVRRPKAVESGWASQSGLRSDVADGFKLLLARGRSVPNLGQGPGNMQAGVLLMAEGPKEPPRALWHESSSTSYNIMVYYGLRIDCLFSHPLGARGLAA